MTKQEYIEQEYGKHYESVKAFLYRDGWLDKLVFQKTDLKYEDLSDLDFEHEGNTFCRPKSLSGIENNNGWIKIESESDLPTEPDFYWCRDNNGAIHQVHYEDITVGYSTHYQTIPKPKPPIY